MNPLIPPLAVSAAYVALWAGRTPATRLLTALREPNPDLAMTRLWNAIRAERKSLPQGCPEDADLGTLAEIVFFLSDHLSARPYLASAIVGEVVRRLRPPPALLPGCVWTRPGVASPWSPNRAAALSGDWQSTPTLHLSAIYADGAELAIVGADVPVITYEEAATVSGMIALAAPQGLAIGLRYGRKHAERGAPGADAALSLAERLAAAVEGL